MEYAKTIEMTDRPWLKNYPEGVPANIDLNEFDTVNSFLSDSVQKFSKLAAFQNFGKSITYKKLDQLSDQFAGFLQSSGLKPGDKLALMMPNLLQYPIALFGALKAGIIVVNTNPLYTPREMQHQFLDAEVSAVLIAENFAYNLEKIADKVNLKLIITTSVGELLGFVKGKMINGVIKYIKRGVPRYNLPNAIKFSEALKTGRKAKLTLHEGQADDVIMLQYTGGTTGVSKGAMLTNKNLIVNMLMMKAWMKKDLIEGKEVTLSPLPMYHIFAFSVNCLAMMSFGAETVLVTNPRDLNSVIKEFKRNNITLMSGVNTLFNALNGQKAFQDLDFSNLKIVVAGGMALQQSVAQEWEGITGVKVAEGYGMTEASPVVTINPLNGNARTGYIGMPVPSTDVRIVNDDGEVLGFDEVGEIQVKGPQVMKGYYKRPDETANTIISDGWLCTGDMAFINNDGYLKIVDRKKDMILVSGFNVFPNEIEETVALHPKVMEVAAVGVPDEKSGEIVKIFVVKKDKSLNKEELIAHCRENLTGYKVPKQVEFKDELPKSNVGKILRRKLRDS